ncbi:MAG: hypothetical protein IOC52_10455 [Methylobacterium sp.]|nr:hypothetical protein [Methylobacterium sp.]
MAIKPGTLDDFSGSMAKAIEDQLNTMLINDGLPGLPMDNDAETRDRRRLFVAIARGVVAHLHAHETSLKVHYVDGGTNRVTSVEMSVTGI